MRIFIDRFSGIRPATEPHLLENHEAQTALNTRIETGGVDGLPAATTLKALTKSAAKTLWRYPGSIENDYWLEFNGRAQVARSPVNQDVYDRIYWTESNGPRYGPASLVLAGSTLPGTNYSLGVPAPTNLPNVTFTAGSGATAESRVYMETFVSAYGEEGPRGPISVAHTVDPAASCTITNLTPAPTGSWALGTGAKRRLYRSSYSGTTLAAFQKVGDDLPIATTSYVDSISQSNLGPVWDSENYLAPPTTAYGLVITDAGVAVLLDGRQIYMSEQDLPHAYNPDYNQTLQFKAVAAAAFQQMLVVMTEGDLYVAVGVDPASLQLTRLQDSQACLTAAGVVVTRGGCYYPSPDGLIAIGTNLVPELVTRGLYTQNQWLDLNPSSFIASLQNGKYHAFYTKTDGTTGLIIIDPTGKSAPLVTGSQVAGSPVQAAYRDPTSDILYVARGGNIQRIAKVGTPQTWVWRSKEYRFDHPQIFSAFSVGGAAGTMTFRAYCDGVLKYTKPGNTNTLYRMPTGLRYLRWSFEVESNVKMVELRVAPSVEEIWQQ